MYRNALYYFCLSAFLTTIVFVTLFLLVGVKCLALIAWGVLNGTGVLIIGRTEGQK